MLRSLFLFSAAFAPFAPAVAQVDPCLQADPARSSLSRSFHFIGAKVVARCRQVLDGARSDLVLGTGSPLYRLRDANLCILEGYSPEAQRKAFGFAGAVSTETTTDAARFDDVGFFALGVEGGRDFHGIDAGDESSMAGYALSTPRQIVIHETLAAFAVERFFTSVEYDRHQKRVHFQVWLPREDSIERSYLYDVTLQCDSAR